RGSSVEPERAVVRRTRLNPGLNNHSSEDPRVLAQVECLRSEIPKHQPFLAAFVPGLHRSPTVEGFPNPSPPSATAFAGATLARFAAAHRPCAIWSAHHTVAKLLRAPVSTLLRTRIARGSALSQPALASH